MAISISPTATHDITKQQLSSPERLQNFGGKIVACCMVSQELFRLANTCLNFDANVATYSRNDFLHPVDGLVFSGMQEFAQCWVSGNPWPQDALQWATALIPHLDHFFKKNPEFPVSYKEEALRRMLELPLPQMGDMDRVCDGLVDYVVGVRYQLLERKAAYLDPAYRRAEYAKVARSVRVPGTKADIQSTDEFLNLLFTASPPTKPITTGVRNFDYYYGSKALGGDAMLFFAHPGGGKTNAACQTAAFTAASGKLVMYVSTEVKKQILLFRMCSAGTSTAYNLIKGVAGGDPGSPQARTFITWLTAGPGRNICVFDYRDVVGIDYRERLDRMLDTFVRTYGRPPDLLIWDWIGGALDSGYNTPWEKREAYNGVANLMVAKAGEMDNATMTLAQADKETKNKTNLHESNTADSKSLADRMTLACGFTALMQLSESNAQEQETYKDEQYWVVCKCREEVSMRLPVLRNFGLARFESVVS